MLNCIMVLVAVVLLICVSMFWFTKVRYTFEESIACSIMLLLTLIFFTGLVDAILIGLGIYMLIALTGLIFFIKCLYLSGKTKEEQREYLLLFFNPSFVFLMCIMLLGIVAFKNIQINNWDELAQWGKAVKYMLDTNHFAAGDDFNGEELLISTTTFFHYFISRFASWLTGRINEGNFYISNLILWFSGLLFSLSGITWKKGKVSAAYIVSIFLLMNLIFVQPYYNIYCDQAIAMWAGAFIVWWIHCQKETKHTVLAILVLSNIALMKNMVGPLFVLVDVFLMVVIYLAQNGIKNLGSILKSKAEVLRILLIGCTPFIFTVIWSVMVKDNALVRKNMVIKDDGNRLILTVRSSIVKCFEALNLNKAFPYISYMTFFLFTILVFVLLKYIYDKQSKHWIIYRVLISLYLMGFLLYLGVMIYAYMTAFSYADSIAAGSLHRYFSDYVMLGIIPLLYPLFIEDSIKDKKTALEARVIKVIICTGIFLFSVAGMNHDIVGRLTDLNLQESESYKERKRFKNYKKKFDDFADEDDKIYFINQQYNGYYTVVADYEFGNQISRQDLCYYFFDNKELSGTIAGLKEFPIQFLPEKLVKDQYKYIWIYEKDDYLETKFYQIFHIDNINKGDIFKVNVDKMGYVSLEFIKNVNE